MTFQKSENNCACSPRDWNLNELFMAKWMLCQQDSETFMKKHCLRICILYHIHCATYNQGDLLFYLCVASSSYYFHHVSDIGVYWPARQTKENDNWSQLEHENKNKNDDAQKYFDNKVTPWISSTCIIIVPDLISWHHQLLFPEWATSLSIPPLPQPVLHCAECPLVSMPQSIQIEMLFCHLSKDLSWILPISLQELLGYNWWNCWHVQ